MTSISCAVATLQVAADDAAGAATAHDVQDEAQAV